MIFIAIVNAEIFLFGKKLAGEEAGIYLIVNAFVGILFSVLILKKNYQTYKEYILLSSNIF